MIVAHHDPVLLNLKSVAAGRMYPCALGFTEFPSSFLKACPPVFLSRIPFRLSSFYSFLPNGKQAKEERAMTAITSEQISGDRPSIDTQGFERQPVNNEREQLILEHLPQVRLIARRLSGRLPLTVNLDDLISAGVVGLIAAVDYYSASHRVKLKTYAEYKIRGAMLDSLRGMDWATRQQRKRRRLIEKAILVLEQRLQRVPAEEEVAAELQLPLFEYQEWLTETQGLTLGSLESAGFEETGRDLLQFVADTKQSSPSEVIERTELEGTLAQVVERLPKIERTVLTLYFYEELTLREIAKTLDLHESRVSQLKSQAILRLRACMQRRWASAAK